MKSRSFLACLVISLFPTFLAAEETKPGVWSGVTLEQVLDYLDLDGGNVQLDFDNPVYMNAKIVRKNGPEKPEKTEYDAWSADNSKRFKISALISKMKHKEGGRRIEFEQKNLDKGNGSGFTYIMLPFEKKFDVKREGGVWNNFRLKAELNQDIPLYEYYDDDAPDEYYFKLMVRFSATRPLED